MTGQAPICERCGRKTVGVPVHVGAPSDHLTYWLCGRCAVAVQRWLRGLSE